MTMWWDPKPFLGLLLSQMAQSTKPRISPVSRQQAEVGPTVAKRLFRVVCLGERVDWNLAWLWESVLTSRMLGVAVGINFSTDFLFYEWFSSSFLYLSYSVFFIPLEKSVFCWFSEYIYFLRVLFPSIWVGSYQLVMLRSWILTRRSYL